MEQKRFLRTSETLGGIRNKLTCGLLYLRAWVVLIRDTFITNVDACLDSPLKQPEELFVRLLEEV